MRYIPLLCKRLLCMRLSGRLKIAQDLGRVGSIRLLDGWSGMLICHFLAQTLIHLHARHLAAASEPMDAAF